MLSQVIVECQKHKDYQESIRWLIDFLEECASHGRQPGQGLPPSAHR